MTFSESTPSTRITLTSIAKKLNVSQPVVGSVLGNGTIRVSRETAQRIRKTAREMGYRPNAAARAVATGRFNTVALILSTVGYRSLLPDELLDGILETLDRREQHLTLAKFSDEELVADDIVPQVFREYMCDGLLINYNAEIPQPLLEHVASAGLPAIWINSKQKTNCVHPDDFEAGRMAAMKVAESGHCHTAYVSLTGQGHYSAADRRDGLVAGMKSVGGTCRVFEKSVGGRGPETVETAQKILTGRRRFTAVVTYTIWEAKAIIAAAQLTGINIPHDLSLLTFGRDPLDFTDINVSTLRLNEYALGQTSVEMLLQRINHPEKKIPAQTIPFTYLPGETLAAPAKPV